MSDFDVLAWMALVAGLLVAALFFLGRVLDRPSKWLHRWWGTRLQRRLADRLRRGEDRYFEERRAIEAAIEHHEKSQEQHQWQLPLVRSLVAGIAAASLALIIVRDLVAPALHQTVPGWATADLMLFLSFAVVGQAALEWWFRPDEQVA